MHNMHYILTYNKPCIHAIYALDTYKELLNSLLFNVIHISIHAYNISRVNNYQKGAQR